jgi:hypothetical protein
MFEFGRNHPLFSQKFSILLVFMRDIAFENLYFILVSVIGLSISSMYGSSIF